VVGEGRREKGEERREKGEERREKGEGRRQKGRVVLPFAGFSSSLLPPPSLLLAQIE
jgi:hypothetical protein